MTTAPNPSVADPGDLDLDDVRTALVGISPHQQIAVELLATGSGQEEAAKAAGVTRESVNRWVNHHPGFQAALARYRMMIYAEHLGRALRIRGKAYEKIENNLDAASMDVALTVLRAVPLPDFDRRTDPEDILATEVHRRIGYFDDPPIMRTPEGVVESFSLPDPTFAADWAELAERSAVEGLADDADVLDTLSKGDDCAEP